MKKLAEYFSTILKQESFLKQKLEKRKLTNPYKTNL